jgi:hypothetical protein
MKCVLLPGRQSTIKYLLVFSLALDLGGLVTFGYLATMATGKL